MFDPEKRRLKRAEEKAKTEEFLGKWPMMSVIPQIPL